MKSLIWRTTKLVVLLMALVLMPAAASAGTVTSTFDDGADGWTATEPDEVAWAPAGGNPDGYLRFEELSGVNTYIIAPPAFLGDWSALEGSGSLQYDHKIFSTG